MGFLNTNSMPRLVEKLADGDNIKITGNSKGNRVGTVVKKIVEKADDVTKAIEQEVVNDSYSFKIGAGDVDVSTDVEDGFGEVGVKGVTYQNLVDVSKSYQNLSFVAIKDGSIEFLELGADMARTIFNDMTLLKPNTKYTIITDCERMCTSNEQNMPIRMNNDGTSYNINVFGLNVEKVGITSMLFTTPSDVSNLKLLFYNNPKNAGFKFKYILILEGDHTNNLNLPSYFEGIVGVGDKSKNLLNPSLHDGLLDFGNYFMTNKSYGSCNEVTYNLKPNTNYTLSFKKYGEDACWVGVIINGEYVNNKNYPSFSKTITTDSTGIITLKFGANTPTDTSSKIYDLQLRESNSVLNYEPYYDGYKIKILSCGKNLYKPNLQTKSANGLTFSLYGNTLIVNGTCTNTVDFRPVNGNHSETLELFNYVNKLPVGTTLTLSNNLGLINYFGLKRNNSQAYLRDKLTITENDKDIGCFVRFEAGQSYDNAELNIQLEISDIATSYEPYREDKTQILLDEPLMRLPNGVCDEITRDGKLIKRVGKVILDGNEKEIWLNNIRDGRTQFVLHNVLLTNPSLSIYQNGNAWCDTLPVIPNDNPIRAIWVYEKNNIVIQLPVEIADTIDKLRAWLSQNPTTVYYELAEPVITELPSSYVRYFKDGHLTFNTLVAPESNHVVQLNKSAQIERSIREVQSLDSRVRQLESFYDDMMLETSHKLNLLTYDFEYTKESEDI